MSAYRFYLLFKTSERKRTFEHNDYISYQKLAHFEESYLYLLAFLTFISTAKFLKLLRFNKKMNVLGYTLLYIAKSFVSFMVAMGMVFFAYSHMAYLVFNTLLLEFSTIISSMSTLFTLMLNKFDYKSMERANPVFAPLIFITFTVSMGFMMVNFMLSLIIEGFTTVRADLADKPNKYELVDFVVSKFKGVMGLGIEDAPPVRDKHEDFVEDSQKELDVKFGEFSERVFGMFLQDPDDMKTMKMAEDLITREKKMKQRKKIVVVLCNELAASSDRRKTCIVPNVRKMNDNGVACTKLSKRPKLKRYQ
ncbi:polycystin-2-like [Watersipora subatra]|uniref:polycystin-2-like n=1 Tax=Watersipora subatra TaxID=2589382 RepID=UPI00355B5190